MIISRPTVLVVDDDAGFNRLMALRLGSGGFDVSTALSGEEALGRLEAGAPDVVVSDLRMGGMDGLELFAEIRRRWPALPVVLLTAHGTIPDAVEATRAGAYAFLTKPVDGKELLSTLRAAIQLPGGGADPAAREDWRADLLGRSTAMSELLQRAKRVADSEASVLITGESGTGKELLARALHRASRRAGGPFIAVNCAAVPENLLEAELFGYRRGAFTGATGDHKGLLQAADGGVLLLDEVGDMPLPFQAKLLRALQERCVRPVGAIDSVAFDVRVLSATHADLRARVAEGSFREDLLYRLDVVSLRVPSLRERRDDIPLLAASFAAEIAARDARPAPTFAPAATEALLQGRWPGNIRQLRNVVEYALAMTQGAVIAEDTVRDALRERADALPTLDSIRREAERAYLVQVLRVAGGNVTRAAQSAGRNRTELYRLLRRHGIDPTAFRDEADEG